MAERGLDEVDRRAVVEGVTGVGVPKPVGADSRINAGALGRLAHDGPNPIAVQGPPTPGWKHRLLRAGRAAERHQPRPHRRGKLCRDTECTSEGALRRVKNWRPVIE